jgi:aspartyl-tRNA(Asn)/glutamyl-tRNA(Gln) amidotransferase subunit A
MEIPSTLEDLCYTPAVRLGQLIREKKLGAVEVADAFLARIEQVNPKLNAYVTVDPEWTRRAAEAAEKRLAQGGAVSPLHGVPFSIKDLTRTRGIRTTSGSRARASFVPDRDAPCVERMFGAGGVPLGKTNTPEFGWLATTDNEVFGATNNPWDLSRTSSGSSGGAAAAAAAGLAPVSLGSDGGGSIRHPAAFCGIFGFKPSFGVVPNDPASDGWFTLSNSGPLTRTVADAAAAMDALAGFDGRAMYSAPLPMQHFLKNIRRSLKGLRVAYTPDLGYAQIDPAVRKNFEAALPAFAELGCELRPASPDMRETREIFKWVMFGELIGEDLRHIRPDGTSDLSPALHQFVVKRKDLYARDYMKGMEMRRALVVQVHEFFKDYDLLITPTMAIPPFKHPKDMSEYPHTVNGVEVGAQGWHPFTFPFNLTGQPAATVPSGFTADGLPLGVQIVGRKYEDLLVMQASAAFEEVRPWAQKRPAV